MKKELLEIAQLLLTIEEKGIASVSYDYTGSIPFLGVRLYEGKDYSHPHYFSNMVNHYPEQYAKCIEVLKAVIENGLTAIPGYEAKQAEIREAKQEQLKKLQAELAA